MIDIPIYKPEGRAKEYGDLAINIYTGCPHRCTYCYVPRILRRDKETFHSNVEPRKDIVESVKRQLDRDQITGKLIHLCFTCDPYPIGVDTTPTREIIKAIKDSGNHVQILTKGGMSAERDFDLLDNGDWFGVTYTGCTDAYAYKVIAYEPNASPWRERLNSLVLAHKTGVNTWVSMEPAINNYNCRVLISEAGYIDLFRIGKLNYRTSGINWGVLGRMYEHLCKIHNRNYVIKDDLRREMERGA